MLQVGDKLPTDIELIDHNGQAVTLAEFLGKYLVIYFYPEDDTPGCTVEACEFRDFNDEIRKLGAEIIGISQDDTDSHEKFKEKYKLNFRLLSDPQHIFQEAVGVWVEKNMFGNKYMGTQRTTFLVDPKGEIVHVWEKVKPEGHALEVLRNLEVRLKT